MTKGEIKEFAKTLRSNNRNFSKRSNMITKIKNDGWINTNEQTPRDSFDLIVKTNEGVEFPGFYHDGKWHLLEKDNTLTILNEVNEIISWYGVTSSYFLYNQWIILPAMEEAEKKNIDIMENIK